MTTRATFSKKETIGLVAVVMIGLLFITTTSVYAGGKGLKVNLFIDNRQGAQQGVIDTYQHDYIVQTDYQYLVGDKDGGYNGIILHYPAGAVETGPFMICVILERDNLESCANGHNHEAKQPELVEIFFGPEYRYPDQQSQPASSSAASSASESESNSESESSATQSQSQSTTVINCPENRDCVIREN